MIEHKVVWHNNEAAAWLCSKRGYDGFDFRIATRARCDRLYIGRTHRWLEIAKIIGSVPGAVSGLNNMATRFKPGAISVSNSNILAVIADSEVKKLVMFPPGCGSPATNPSPTGSLIFAAALFLAVAIVELSITVLAAPGVAEIGSLYVPVP